MDRIGDYRTDSTHDQTGTIWEQLNNPDFNPIEFDGFRKQTGLNSFILAARQWIEKTHTRVSL